MNTPRDQAAGLLNRASHDLVAARAIIATGEALDTVCFHAQQAAEKSIKALLAIKQVAFPWRHDLGELLALTTAHFPSLTTLAPALVALSPYAVEVRYSDALDPTLLESQEALAAAEQAYEFARQVVDAVPP